MTISQRLHGYHAAGRNFFLSNASPSSWLRVYCGYDIKKTKYRKNMPHRLPFNTDQHWQTVLNATEDIVFIKNEKSEIVAANKRFLNLYAKSPEELIGTTAFESFPEDEKKSFYDIDKKAFNAGSSRNDIKVTSEKTGDVYYFDMNKTRFEIDGKHYLLCSGRDITLYKQYVMAVEEVTHVIAEEHELAEKMRYLLKIGNKYLQTDHAIVSRIDAEEYTVLFADSADVTEGTAFDLGNTFCDVTVKKEGVVQAHDTALSEFKYHPCLEIFKLGCYIGVPFWVNGRLLGTINFSAAEAKAAPFNEHQLRFLDLLRERVSFTISEMEKEKALLSSQAMFQKALEGAAHGIALVSLEGKWLKVNKSLCDMLGYAEEDFLNTADFQTITHHDDLEIDLKLVRECIAGKRDKYTLEKRYIKKSGELFHGLLSVAIVRNEDDIPQFFISQIQDVEMRYQYEQQLIETTRELQAVLDTAEDGIVTLDGKGEVLSFNRSAERIFGYKAIEIVGEKFVILMGDASKRRYLSLVEGPEDNGVKYIVGAGRKVVGLHRSGKEIPLELTVSEIYNRGDEGALYSAIMRDITLRLEYEENLERYNRELKRSNEELENFARATSHDLREPLRGIYNFSQFMKEDYEDVLDKAGMDRLSAMMKMTKRMEGILSGLFDYARIGRMNESVSIVNVKEVVDNIKLDIGRLLNERGACVEFSGVEKIHTYHALMDMVLRNLITNGLKYSQAETPTVNVTHSIERGTHTICVSDNGVGVAEEYFETIFQPFKRLSSRKDEDGDGTGMGLALVQKAVANMGGYVKVSSTVGEGTAFTIYLPEKPAGSDGAENVCWLDDV